MKKNSLLFAFIILASFYSKAQDKINWISFEEAIEKQKTVPKKIMIDMYTVWCGPCKMLDKNTFQNKSVAEYVNENYYAVKFNAEGNDVVTFEGNIYKNGGYDPNKAKKRNSGHELAAYFGVRAYPTIVFLDEKAAFITPLKGYRTPTQLELFLKLFKDDTYKTITTKEDFEKFTENFKYEFTD